MMREGTKPHTVYSIQYPPSRKRTRVGPCFQTPYVVFGEFSRFETTGKITSIERLNGVSSSIRGVFGQIIFVSPLG